MAKRPILGIFNDANAAADAGDGLKAAGVSENDYDFLTDAPYPEGAFGEREEKHRIYLFPFIGALLGLTSGIILTSMTQVAYPLVTGGKPILALPPMFIIAYEGTMLGAILSTIIGVIFESRLPRAKMGLYDPRITEGYIGLVVVAPEGEEGRIDALFKAANAADVKLEPISA